MSVKQSVLRFKFDKFEDLPTVRNEETLSDRVSDDHQNEWRLVCFPGGTDVSKEGMVAMHLESMAMKWLCEEIEAKFELILRNSTGKVHFHANYAGFSDTSRVDHTILFDEIGDRTGDDNFIERSVILDKTNNILLDGALLIDVHLQMKTIPDELSQPVSPSPRELNMLKFLENETSTDISFDVCKEIICAHKLILEMNAPTLFDCCEGNKEDSSIPIKGTSPKVFRMLLRYIYGGEVPSYDAIEAVQGIHIIKASNRYGVVGLKIAVERALVQSLVLHHNSIVDWLIFSDSMTCPLLKEYAISYIAARSDDIMASNKWNDLKQCPDLLGEIISVVSNKSTSDKRFDSTGINMSVTELREKLEEKGLDIDGSKEMLISRLDESKKRQRTE